MRWVLLASLAWWGCTDADDPSTREDAGRIADAQPAVMCTLASTPADTRVHDRSEAFLNECDCFLEELFTDPEVGCEVLMVMASAAIVIDGPDPEETLRSQCARSAAMCVENDLASPDGRQSVCQTLLDTFGPCDTFASTRSCFESLLAFREPVPSCSMVPAIGAPRCAFGGDGACD